MIVNQKMNNNTLKFLDKVTLIASKKKTKKGLNKQLTNI